MKLDEQLKMWKAGISVHNMETDECCPDFSCCKPECAATAEERVRYVSAHVSGDKTVLHPMIGRFIGKVFKTRVEVM